MKAIILIFGLFFTCIHAGNTKYAYSKNKAKDPQEIWGNIFWLPWPIELYFLPGIHPAQIINYGSLIFEPNLLVPEQLATSGNCSVFSQQYTQTKKAGLLPCL